MLTFAEFCDESIDEAIKIKRRVRRGKIQRAKVSSKKGKGWTIKKGREVRISPTELKKMSIRNLRSARKSKGKRAMANVKRQRSMNKRTGI